MSRVIRFHQFGPPEVLKCEELPTPAPAAGEVLVRVQAIGVSWKDVLWRQNLAPEQAALPSDLGFELAACRWVPAWPVSPPIPPIIIRPMATWC